MALYLQFVVLGLLFVGGDAGSRFWEPHNVAVHAMDNKTSLLLHKRALTVNPGGGDTAPRLWPNAEIKYCWESDATKEKLLYNLQAAVSRWHQSGLPESKFKLTPATASECRNNRANTLLIRYNTEGSLSTTPAIPPRRAGDNSYLGPTMDLSDATNVGMLEVIANYAHELGHAWGLLHEHQNPSFWAPPYSTVSLSSLFTFNCQNLKDYTEVMARFPSPADQQRLCTDRAFALDKQFSASEFLPIIGASVHRGHTGASDDDDVDWASIMLYPSGAGGTGEASAGNDQRNSVIERASDNTRIPINLYPSGLDVAALIELYSIDWATSTPKLPNQKSHKFYSKFKGIFGKKNGCEGSSSG